jgi:uncharacterized protein (TIGR03083 family)
VGVTADNDVRELLGAYALDALSAGEVEAVEALIARDADAAAEADRLRGVAGLLALAEAIQPPASVRDTVFAAATARRPPAAARGPLALYERETARTLSVVERSAAAAGEVTTPNGLSAHDLVTHLAAVESLVVEALGGISGHEDAPADIDGRTAALLPRYRGRPLAAATSEWRRLHHLVRAHAGDPARPVAWRGGELSVGDLLVARAFEIWTHGDDLRRVGHEETAPPDGEGLALMSDLSARWLPLGLELVGRARPGAAARLELTGAGGATWTVPLGGAAPGSDAEPVATVRVGVVEWCRVVAERLDPTAVRFEVDGDVTVAADLLAAAPAFATL